MTDAEKTGNEQRRKLTERKLSLHQVLTTLYNSISHFISKNILCQNHSKNHFLRVLEVFVDVKMVDRHFIFFEILHPTCGNLKFVSASQLRDGGMGAQKRRAYFGIRLGSDERA